MYTYIHIFLSLSLSLSIYIYIYMYTHISVSSHGLFFAGDLSPNVGTHWKGAGTSKNTILGTWGKSRKSTALKKIPVGLRAGGVRLGLGRGQVDLLI